MRSVKNWLTMSLFVMAVAAMSLVASAQPGGRGGPGGPRPGGFGGPGGPGGRGPGGGGVGMLLQNPQMAEILKITEDQKAKLDALRDEMREQFQANFGDLREKMQNASQEERAEMFEKMREQGEALRDKVEEKIKGILTEEQVKRARQIQLQVSGGTAAALQNSRVIEALKLTDEQTQKLTALREDAQAKMRSAMEGVREQFRNVSPEDRGELMQKIRTQMEELREDIETKALAILTDQQKATLKELLGEPVDLESLRPRRPQGGQPGRGPGRGPGQGQGGRFRPAPGQGRGDGEGRPRAFPGQGRGQGGPGRPRAFPPQQ